MSKGFRVGRPQRGELADYAQADVDVVDGDDAIAALLRQRDETVAIFQRFTTTSSAALHQ